MSIRMTIPFSTSANRMMWRRYRLEIPGYVSARRFKLEEGNGVLKYLCIWELEDPSTQST